MRVPAERDRDFKSKVCDPRHVNDRLLLGLKGTMSEYELSLMRQRGLAARDAKAGRGELRFTLPPGYCWSEAGQVEIDPDEHVAEAIRLVFRKFRELGSARQVFLWARFCACRHGRPPCAPGSTAPARSPSGTGESARLTGSSRGGRGRCPPWPKPS